MENSGENSITLNGILLRSGVALSRRSIVVPPTRIAKRPVRARTNYSMAECMRPLSRLSQHALLLF